MLKGGVPMQEIEQIYTQYRQDVYRYLCSLTRDAALAEDLLSDVPAGAHRAERLSEGRMCAHLAVQHCTACLDRRAAAQTACTFR